MEMTNERLRDMEEVGNIVGYTVDSPNNFHCADGMYSRMGVRSIITELVNSGRAELVGPGHNFEHCYVHGPIRNCP